MMKEKKKKQSRRKILIVRSENYPFPWLLVKRSLLLIIWRRILFKWIMNTTKHTHIYICGNIKIHAKLEKEKVFKIVTRINNFFFFLIHNINFYKLLYKPKQLTRKVHFEQKNSSKEALFEFRWSKHTDADFLAKCLQPAQVLLF